MKQKNRLAAVSPKSDQVFWSGGCNGSGVLVRPAISKEAEANGLPRSYCLAKVTLQGRPPCRAPVPFEPSNRPVIGYPYSVPTGTFPAANLDELTMPLATSSTVPSDRTFPVSEYQPGLPLSPFSPLKTPPLTSASTSNVKLPAPSAGGQDTMVVHLPSKGPALCAPASPLIATVVCSIAIQINARMVAAAP